MCKCNAAAQLKKWGTSKACMRKVLIDLLLSITVSLPTSIRPICVGSMLYFSRSEVTTVKLNNLRSVHNKETIYTSTTN